mgnify:CR=1 FL=1
MKKSIFFIIALCATIMLGSIQMMGQEQKSREMVEGEAMPEFVLNSEMFGELSSVDLKGKVILITFFATWCGPCKMMAPIMDELAAEYDGEVYIYKVDTEAEQELAQVFGIRSIPSILFIPMDGQPMMSQGAMPKAELKKIIDEKLKN